jgi:hypothetical protein
VRRLLSATAGALFGLTGCSLGNYDYLSVDYGKIADQPSVVEGGSVPATGLSFCRASSMVGDAADTAESSDALDASSDASPEVPLPVDGARYFIRMAGTANDCLVTPTWPDIGPDKQRHVSLYLNCGIGDAGAPFYTDQAWHMSHICDDVFRLSVFPETIGRERQLAAVDMGAVPGTELESVDGTGSNEPYMLFRTRLRAPGATVDRTRWEIAPVHADQLCIDQDKEVVWGTRLLPRVVLNDCQEDNPKQSWELVPVPRTAN